MHMWKDCSGSLAQGSFAAKQKGSKQFLVGGRKCVWVPMAKSAVQKKKWKGMSVFGKNEKDQISSLKRLEGNLTPKQKNVKKHNGGNDEGKNFLLHGKVFVI